MRGTQKSAACSLYASVQAASVEQRDQLPVKSMRTGRLCRVVVNLARHLRPRCASSRAVALLSAKAWPSRLGGGRGSAGSVERPSRILPFRQSILANKAELDLKCPCNRHVGRSVARVRTESSRRPPRHRRDACSIAWRRAIDRNNVLPAQARARRRATSSATGCDRSPAKTGTASTAASRSAVLRVSAARRSAAREVVLSRRAHGARGFPPLPP